MWQLDPRLKGEEASSREREEPFANLPHPLGSFDFDLVETCGGFSVACLQPVFPPAPHPQHLALARASLVALDPGAVNAKRGMPWWIVSRLRILTT